MPPQVVAPSNVPPMMAGAPPPNIAAVPPQQAPIPQAAPQAAAPQQAAAIQNLIRTLSVSQPQQLQKIISMTPAQIENLPANEKQLTIMIQQHMRTLAKDLQQQQMLHQQPR